MNGFRFSLFAVGVAAALTAVAPLAAQTAPMRTCTHMVPREMEPAFKTVGVQTCGVGFRGLIGNFQIDLGSAVCPVMVLITPRRSVAVFEPNAETDVVVTGQVPNLLVTFKCVTTRFLFIPIGDTCEIGEVRNAGSVDNYGLVPCVPSASTAAAK